MTGFFRWGQSADNAPTRGDGYSSMFASDRSGVGRIPSQSWESPQSGNPPLPSGDDSNSASPFQTRVPSRTDVLPFSPPRNPSGDMPLPVGNIFFAPHNGQQQATGSNFGGFGGNFYFALAPQLQAQIADNGGFPIQMLPAGSSGSSSGPPGGGFFPGAIVSNGSSPSGSGSGFMPGAVAPVGGATGSPDRGKESAQGERALRCQRCLGEMQAVLEECERMFPKVSPEQRGPLVSQAHRRLTTLDREVVFLLSHLQKLPANHPVHSAGLWEKHRQLLQDLQQLESVAKQFMKPVPKDSTSAVDTDTSGKLSGQAPMLHSKLEELDAALEQFRMSGSDVHSIACKTADHASAAFEHFRACISKDPARPHDAKILNALRGFSEWSDPGKVQRLLQKRQYYLLHRFECGKTFLKLEGNVEDWSRAEPYARSWQKVVLDTLGQHGILDWDQRARNMHSGASSSSSDSGTLRIRAIRASNLRCTDVWDQPNPYVVFELCGKTMQTEPVFSNEPEPEWKSELRFDVESLSRSPLLKVHVRDFNRFTADDFLGHVDEGAGGINLAHVLSGKHPSCRTQHASQGGAASWQVARLPLRGDKAGTRGAQVEFEVHFETASGDPLVFQPQQSDEALQIFAHVQERVDIFLRRFARESEGFFLQEQDTSGNAGLDSQLALHGKENGASTQKSLRTHLSNMGSAMGSFFQNGAYKTKSPEMQLAQEMKKEVFDYNETLDLLNVMTSDKDHMAVQASSLAVGGASEASMSLQGILSPGGHFDAMSLAEQHTVSKRFSDAMEHIRHVERSVAHDALRRRVYAQQDILLPQIGVWSIDRRRHLRDQVFRATMRVQGWRRDVDGFKCRQIAFGIAFVVSLFGLLLYGCFGPGDSWKFAGIGLAVLFVLPCIILGMMYQQGSWKPQRLLAEVVSKIASARDTQRQTPDNSQNHPFANGDGRGMYARVMANH
mmetsp:Transcript_41066/g.64190  ORF Transcript_41066/g.64190 Transcript_41066/m.64190 type:complete len:953 (-) Transcript_41066:66-2924(-)